MQKYQDVVLNQNGNPVSGVQVTVTDLLGTPVSVYSANAIGLNVNPLTSDNNGRFSFYAPDGRYSLSFSFGGNVVASITDILLEDPMDGSDAVFNDVTIIGELSDASKVTSAPVGGLIATNVQAALAELDSEKIDASSLAATGGSALVGYDSGTAQDVLDEAKPMANYTALRAYTGRATGVRITQPGLAGFFQRDDADTTSADNGGTIIVDASGRRWKRLFKGGVWLDWFGAKSDANEASAPLNDDAFVRAIAVKKPIMLSAGVYYVSDTIKLDMMCASLAGVGFHYSLTDRATWIRPVSTFRGRVIELSQASGNYVFFVKISNLTIYGNEPVSTSGVYPNADATAIELGKWASYVVFDRVLIRRFTSGIKAGYLNHANNVEIKGCDIQECKYGINTASKTVGADRWEINAFWVHHNQIAYNYVGILFSGNNYIIESNTIQANSKHAVQVNEDTAQPATYTYASTIRKNYFEGNGRGESGDAFVIGVYHNYVSTSSVMQIRQLSISANHSVESGATPAGGTLKAFVLTKAINQASTPGVSLFISDLSSNAASVKLLHDSGSNVDYGGLVRLSGSQSIESFVNTPPSVTDGASVKLRFDKNQFGANPLLSTVSYSNLATQKRTAENPKYILFGQPDPDQPGVAIFKFLANETSDYFAAAVRYSYINASGSPGSQTVTVEASNDGVTWYVMGAAQTFTTNGDYATGNLSQIFYKNLWIRITISAVSGGAALFNYAGIADLQISVACRYGCELVTNSVANGIRTVASAPSTNFVPLSIGPNETPFFFESAANKLWIWNGTAWKSVTLA